MKPALFRLNIKLKMKILILTYLISEFYVVW